MVENELLKTTAILYASLIVCILSSLTVMHQLKPHWFDKIPKWEIGTTTLAFVESANQRDLNLITRLYTRSGISAPLEFKSIVL